jgi:4'-phosphopantetheinyl transferase
MPLIINENITDDSTLGVWKIEETAEILHSQTRLTSSEEDHYTTLKSQVRKQQWLSYHALLAKLIGHESCEVTYDQHGKPYLTSGSHSLSVTHSGEYSAVILGKNCRVGIDLEKIKERVERVKSMFLSGEELDHLGEVNLLEKLTICWGAKEALFKIGGDPSLLCMQDITIEAFDYLCSGEGSAYATIKHPSKTVKYTFFYRKIVDYMLVYTYDFSQLK